MGPPRLGRVPSSVLRHPRVGIRPRLWQLRRFGSSTAKTAARLQTVASVCRSDIDFDTFQDRAYRVEQPLHIRCADGLAHSDSTLPAAQRWFSVLPKDDADHVELVQLASYLEPFSMVPLSYELMYPPLLPQPGFPRDPPTSTAGLDGFLAWLADAPISSTMPALLHNVRHHLAELLHDHVTEAAADVAPEQRGQVLVTLRAPLALLQAALAYSRHCIAAAAAGDGHRHGGTSSVPLTQLYIAQTSLAHLPSALQADVPLPALLRGGRRADGGSDMDRNGDLRRLPWTANIRGDIYGSSIWLGLEPTYTPWHRDPNPNLFRQLCSRKRVRLMAPTGGLCLFRAAQCAAGMGSLPPARIRGEEMMQGPQRMALQTAVWGEGTELDGMYEALLAPGDMLFIPKGWWHSVRSTAADGRLNGSVNWWFR